MLSHTWSFGGKKVLLHTMRRIIVIGEEQGTNTTATRFDFRNMASQMCQKRYSMLVMSRHPCAQKLQFVYPQRYTYTLLW
jgi:hypothetical protein